MCSCWALTSQAWIPSSQDWFYPELWSCQGAALCSVSNHPGSLLGFKMPRTPGKLPRGVLEVQLSDHTGVLGCSGRSFHPLSSLWAALKYFKLLTCCAEVPLQSHCSEPEDGKRNSWPDHRRSPGASSAKVNCFGASGNSNSPLLASMGKPFILNSLASVPAWCCLFQSSNKNPLSWCCSAHLGWDYSQNIKLLFIVVTIY